MAKILIVEDDIELLTVMETTLQRVGHTIIKATNTIDAESKLKHYPDLILLDVMMPDEDGFTFCRRIRDIVDVPIIFVTAMSTPDDLVKGLSIGGDDYIMKPFAISELRARVEAHLRREKRDKVSRLVIEEFVFDLQAFTLSFDDIKIDTTKTEYDIVEHLAMNKGQVFSKDQLFERIWGYDDEASVNTIVEHIRNLRAKIKKVTNKEPIKTVWGVGYKWEL